jgi:hypothetical protein
MMVKKMPFKIHELDSSLKEDEATIIAGKHIILKSVERSDQKALLKDPYVQVFLRTPDLTYKDTIEKINRLVEIDCRLDTLAYQESFFGFAQSLFFDPGIRRKFLGKKADREFEESMKKSMEETKIETSFQDFSKVLKELKKMSEEEIDQFSETMSMVFTKLPEAYFEFVQKTIDESNKETLQIEKSLRTKNQELELFESVAVPFCPHCKKSLFLGEKSRYGLIKESVNCGSCRKKVTNKNAKYLYMNKLRPNLLEVWNRGIWLEEYFASILRKIGWQEMWTHVLVLGASGVLHEIDTLGIKGSRVCLVECKTGKVSRTDVFNFWTKVFDIRSHISIYACLEEIPDPETRHFLQNNPSVILFEKIKEIHVDQLVQEVKNSPMGK